MTNGEARKYTKDNFNDIVELHKFFDNNKIKNYLHETFDTPTLEKCLEIEISIESFNELKIWQGRLIKKKFYFKETPYWDNNIDEYIPYYIIRTRITEYEKIEMLKNDIKENKKNVSYYKNEILKDIKKINKLKKNN